MRAVLHLIPAVAILSISCSSLAADEDDPQLLLRMQETIQQQQQHLKQQSEQLKQQQVQLQQLQQQISGLLKTSAPQTAATGRADISEPGTPLPVTPPAVLSGNDRRTRHPATI